MGYGIRTPQGNFAGPPPDYPGVEGCDRVREALSARLDGEELPDQRPGVDAHLAGCPDCRGWLEDATVVTRLARTGPATAGAGVDESVLAAAPGPWRGRIRGWLRVALAGLGVAQVVLGSVQVAALRETTLGDHGSTPDGATLGHLWHESAAWNFALGAAFLWAAVVRQGRPAPGLLPVLAAFLGVLTLLSAADLVDGRVQAARLVSHGFVLAGFLIALALSRPGLGLAPPGGAGTTGRARGSGVRPAGTPDPPPAWGGTGHVRRDRPAAQTHRRMPRAGWREAA